MLKRSKRTMVLNTGIFSFLSLFIIPFLSPAGPAFAQIKGKSTGICVDYSGADFKCGTRGGSTGSKSSSGRSKGSGSSSRGSSHQDLQLKAMQGLMDSFMSGLQSGMQRAQEQRRQNLLRQQQQLGASLTSGLRCSKRVAT